MHNLIQWKSGMAAMLFSVMVSLSSIHPVLSAEVPNKSYVALSPEQGQVLWLQTGLSPAILSFNGQTGALEHSVTLQHEATQLIMGFTPDGFKVARLEAAGLSILHRTGKSLRRLAISNLPQPASRYRPMTAITNATGTAQLFHDTQTPQLQVLHTGNGKILATVALPKARLLALGLDATINKLAYVTANVAGKTDKADLQIYDLFKNKLIKTYSIQAPSPFSQPVVFSWDGKYVAVLPQVINLQTAEQITVKGATGSAVFTTDHQALLFASRQGMQRFDLARKQQQALDWQLPADCQTTVAEDMSVDQQQLAFASLCTPAANSLAVVSFVNAQTGQWQRNLNLAKP